VRGRLSLREAAVSSLSRLFSIETVTSVLEGCFPSETGLLGRSDFPSGVRADFPSDELERLTPLFLERLCRIPEGVPAVAPGMLVKAGQ